MQSKDDIFNYLKGILIEQLECSEADIHPDAKLYDDLDLDSIDAVDMIVVLQRKTKIKVDPDRFKEVKSIQDIVDVVHDLLHE